MATQKKHSLCKNSVRKSPNGWLIIAFNNNNNKSIQQTLAKGENLLSPSPHELSVIKVKCLVINKNHKAYKKTGKNMSHLKVKNKWTINIREEVQTLDLLDKFCKTTVLNMLKDLKENKDK